MWLRLRRVLVFVVLFCGSCSPLPAQSSNPTSIAPDNPFVQPLNLSTLLLQQIDSLVLNLAVLEPKIGALQTLSDEQAKQISLLSTAISDSQSSLSKSQALLAQSEAARAMQEQQLSNSKTSLNDSQTALQMAQNDLKVLLSQTWWLKLTIALLGGSTAICLGAAGMHLAGIW
jgi:septal ring factor EnvC (AmiA/AmiB activator)